MIYNYSIKVRQSIQNRWDLHIPLLSKDKLSISQYILSFKGGKMFFVFFKNSLFKNNYQNDKI